MIHRKAASQLNYVYKSAESEADANGVIDTLHDAVVEMSHLFLETLLVDSPDLLKQDNRILGKTEAVGNHVDMCREPVLPTWLVIAAAMTVGLYLFPTSF